MNSSQCGAIYWCYLIYFLYFWMENFAFLVVNVNVLWSIGVCEDKRAWICIVDCTWLPFHFNVLTDVLIEFNSVQQSVFWDIFSVGRGWFLSKVLHYAFCDVFVLQLFLRENGGPIRSLRFIKKLLMKMCRIKAKILSSQKAKMHTQILWHRL